MPTAEASAVQLTGKADSWIQFILNTDKLNKSIKHFGMGKKMGEGAKLGKKTNIYTKMYINKNTLLFWAKHGYAKMYM